MTVTTYALAGEGHAMLRRPKDWNRLVADFITSARDGGGPAGGTEELPQLGRSTVVAAVSEIAVARFRLPVRERFRF